MKKNKKTKSNIEKKNLKSEFINKNVKQAYIRIREDEFIIKNIVPDGNCFYRSISYFYRETEDDYNEFRQLIFEFIENNIDIYLEYIPEEDLCIPDEKKDDINYINNIRKDYIRRYIERGKKDDTYAGDIEISTAAKLFGANIRIYLQDIGIFILLNEFNEGNCLTETDKDIINILFINNNHF